MKLVQPETELQELLFSYHRMGGVVNYCIFDLEDRDIPCEELFRRAAIETVQSAAPDSVNNLQLAGKMSGVLQSGHVFMGPYWSKARRALLVRGQSEGHRHQHFYANDAESNETAIDLADWIQADGYAHVFGEPPYGIRCTNRAKSDMFGRINELLVPFGMVSTGTIIYSWPTDWSTFFDAGREWWGTYLWTVWQPGRRVIGIAASATD